MAESAGEFTVQRSTVIAAPPERIFPLIEDFHRWTEWSPFDQRDPNLRRTYGGPGRGVGATYGWEGNAKAGSGQMEIVEATAPSRLGVRLEFTKPVKATNTASFELQPGASGTRVTWSMTGRQNLAMRVMGLFMSMDKMIGKDFEEGLGNLERIAETGSA